MVFEDKHQQLPLLPFIKTAYFSFYYLCLFSSTLLALKCSPQHPSCTVTIYTEMSVSDMSIIIPRLETASDWSEWYSEIKSQAEVLLVWKLIDPNVADKKEDLP